MASKVKTPNPTTIAQLTAYKGGEVVELPGFVSDEPFYCRLSQPSMLFLAKTGHFPNQLLARAGDLFKGGAAAVDPDDDDTLSQMYDVMHIICESAMIEPTLADVEDAGLQLSDAQMTAIFAYTQRGINKLTQFRNVAGSGQANISLA